MIADADCILVGAGAGLSTAAGIRYDGEDFRREFRPWIERYGFTDLYSSGFYPFKTEEERWAYWARHIWFSRYRVQALPLYKSLLRLIAGKDYFVITTNVDGQFLKAGINPARLFYTQGDYAYLQDADGEDRQLYYNKEKVMQMLTHTRDCRIPTSMIPHDPANGHAMSVNLRCDETFVEDASWHAMCSHYQDFVGKAASKKLLLLELGVGFNTPAIIRYPFELMAARFAHASLVRFNRDAPHATEVCPRRLISFKEDLSHLFPMLLAKVGNNQ